MYYGDKREAKVMIMSKLIEKGWKVYGYSPDQSDSMTDYYCPASWDGIAEKNGYVIVIDQYNTRQSGYQVKKYNYDNKKYIANERIAKLTAMMNDSASTENEKASCAVLIEKEKEKAGVEQEYTVIETYPTFHHGNPKACSWHIEKDGQIIAKGKGVFSVNEYNWEDKTKTADEQKAEKLNKFIKKIEKVLTDSDALKSEVVKVEKTVIKPVEKEEKTINIGDILSFSYHGHYWIVNDVYTVGEQIRVTYEILGSEKRGYQRKKNAKRYYQPMNRLEKEMQEGRVKVYTLQEVIEYTEKTVFTKTKRSQKATDAIQLETQEAYDTQTQDPKENNATDQEQASKRQLWALHVATNLDTRSLEISKSKASELISKSKNGQSIVDELKALLRHVNESKEEKQEKMTQNSVQTEVREVQSEQIIDELSNNSETTNDQDNVVYHDFPIKQEGGENINGLDDLLSKFDDIEVTAESKVSMEDLEFCKEQEQIYKMLISSYNNFNNQLQEIGKMSKEHGKKFGRQSEAYFHEQKTAHYHSLSKYDYEKVVKEMKNSFISYVCSFFENKYKITIDEEKIKNKYNESVTYEQILEEIYIQMDGFNFTEKAEKEIKDKAREIVRNSDKITIKNKKLIIDSWFSFYNSIWKEYRISSDKCAHIFNALQHYENGSIKGSEELTKKYIGYDNERKLENYERFEPATLNKVVSIKILKNGKLEIEFKSNQIASKFAQEYCGYIQKSA